LTHYIPPSVTCKQRWGAPSIPTAASAYNPDLLREQETPLEIEKNWFLDQKVPAGGFVRILDSSQVWEERVNETRIITTEGWAITSRGWNFLKKQGGSEGHEQALITTIQKETKRTEELEEAGYIDHQHGQYYEHCSRSIVPRQLQEKQRCLPLLSFSRRDEEIYSPGGGKKDQRYLCGRAYQNKKRQVSWKRQAQCTTGSCGVSQKKGRRKSAHLSSAGKRSFLTKMKRNRKRRRTKRTGAKRMHITGRVYDTGHGGSKATSKWQ